MLDRIGDVAIAAIHAGGFERLVEQGAGGADEGKAGEVFLVARLFADEHQPRGLRAPPEHGLRRVFVEVAARAGFRLARQFRQRFDGARHRNLLPSGARA